MNVLSSCLASMMVFLQVSVAVAAPGDEALDELLRSLADGGAIPKVVEGDVGHAAAARITPFGNDDESLTALATIARRGGAAEHLSAALVSVLADRGSTVARATVLLADLPLYVIPKQVPESAIDAAVELARSGPEVAVEGQAEAGATLVGLWGSPDVVRTLLSELVEAGSPQLALRVVTPITSNQSAKPLDWVDMVAALDPTSGTAPAPWTTQLGLVLRDLVLRDTAAADRLADVSASNTGPSGALLRALGGSPLDDADRFERARQLVLIYLEAAKTGEVPTADAVAAIGAGTDLLLAEVALALPTLTAPTNPALVRIAAVRALERVGYRDAPTIDLLIKLLDDADPTVGIAAFEVLRLKSGQTSYTQRKSLWERWRARTTLPESPPDGLEVWLDLQRQLEAQTRRERLTNTNTGRS